MPSFFQTTSRVVLLGFLAYAGAAQAGFYKCMDANGGMQFQQLPCSSGQSGSYIGDSGGPDNSNQQQVTDSAHSSAGVHSAGYGSPSHAANSTNSGTNRNNSASRGQQQVTDNTHTDTNSDSSGYGEQSHESSNPSIGIGGNTADNGDQQRATDSTHSDTSAHGADDSYQHHESSDSEPSGNDQPQNASDTNGDTGDTGSGSADTPYQGGEDGLAAKSPFLFKAHFSGALAELSTLKMLVLQYHQMQGEWPENVSVLGLEPSQMHSKHIQQVKLSSDGAITADLTPMFGSGKEIVLIPTFTMGGTSVDWECKANFSTTALTSIGHHMCESSSL